MSSRRVVTLSLAMMKDFYHVIVTVFDLRGEPELPPPAVDLLTRHLSWNSAEDELSRRVFEKGDGGEMKPVSACPGSRVRRFTLLPDNALQKGVYC